MPLNDDLDKLQAIASDLLRKAEWDDFGSYLDLRARGVRKQAMHVLRAFVAGAKGWD